MLLTISKLNAQVTYLLDWSLRDIRLVGSPDINSHVESYQLLIKATKQKLVGYIHVKRR